MSLPADQHPDKQHGVALVVSLVLLVAMSLIAVSTLSGSRLNERVAANAQQKAIAFEVAESAVAAGFGGWKEGIALIQAGLNHEPPAQRMTSFDSGMSVDYDQTRPSRALATAMSVDIDGEVSIQYCGETSRTYGTDLNADLNEPAKVGMLFDVNGIAHVGNSATRADHVQRGQLTNVATGRRGACVTRGVAP